MTWPVASFLVLGLALIAGFAWYEHERPSARVLALVATLAALAVLGRVAFEPIPNVKPTTDIVLIAGWVLGGPAGFATGAVSGLVSNVFFGQGPWTPFQMLGFGLAGLIGAALGRATGHRPASRWTLAAAGAVAALGYGAVVDFGTAVSGGGEDLAARFAAMNLGTSLPWNLAHAGGCVAFALAFGPALQRALLRFRARFTVAWRPAGALPLAVLALAVLAPAALAASPAGYLRHAQNSDGGWGERPGAPSSSLYTGWATLGLAAYGTNPLDQASRGRSPVDVLRAAGRPADTGALERTILILGAAGSSPRDFAGRDLVAALLARRRAGGAFRGGVTLTAFGVLALRAAGYPPSSSPVRRAVAWLGSQQDRDGGWNFAGRGAGSTPDDTGAVLQALAAGGRRHGRAARRGAGWLARHRRRDGGFAAFGTSNAQSTAYAVQGLVATGRDPAALHRHGARSPLAYLRALTGPDGRVRYSRGSAQTPVWVTAQAALALRRRPFPLPALPRTRHATPGPGPGAAGAAAAIPGRSAAPGRDRSGAPASRPDRSGAHGARALRTAGAISPRVGLAVRVAGTLSALALAPFPAPNG
jgi:Squalene-hopene cyclase C-terminal domain/ECF-type riboflavin transporter, S component/Prenyltransferase and squalene oxidase repeat